ncbi:MAG TPA: methyltransferase domain-containing protein [Candidatus Acidoferrum sp.]|jgi:SAM-dependent methyltransferase|nr:methyltransferase domain-containing protein [Candidatus Acidoferrum sp.]
MPKRKFIFSGVLVLAIFVSLCSAISENEIQRLAKVMNWKAGQVIADVGAGEGEIGFAAASAVGDTGKVYLTELDVEKVAALQKDASRRHLKNVVILAAVEKETKLPDNCCNAIVLRRVYHHFTAPADMDASLLRSLRSGGLLAVIEFAPRKSLTASDPVKGVPSNRGGHGIPKNILVDELTAAGFKPDKTFDDWPDDGYCVLFRKP